MWWPFRRGTQQSGVKGAPVRVGASDPRDGRTMERHETVIERLGMALAKERRGQRRLNRIVNYESELRRHLELLAKMRER